MSEYHYIPGQWNDPSPRGRTHQTQWLTLCGVYADFEHTLYTTFTYHSHTVDCDACILVNFSNIAESSVR